MPSLSGLGAAKRLNQLKHTSYQIVDSFPEAGGLASTDVDENGFLWDVSGEGEMAHERRTTRCQRSSVTVHARMYTSSTCSASRLWCFYRGRASYSRYFLSSSPLARPPFLPLNRSEDTLFSPTTSTSM